MMWITCLSSIRSRNKAHWSFAMWPCVKFPLFKCPKMWGVRLREQHIKRIVWWWQMSCQGEQGEAELSSWNPIQQAEITGWLLLKNQLFWFKTLKQLNKHKRSLSPSLSLSLSMARTWTSERNVLLCAKKKREKIIPRRQIWQLRTCRLRSTRESGRRWTPAAAATKLFPTEWCCRLTAVTHVGV